MALFDFFKNKKKKEQPTSNTSTPNNQASELFPLMKKYSHYVINFIIMQTKGNYAPIAAYEKPDGKIIGFLYLATDDSFNLSVQEVIVKMEEEFEKRLSEKQINSYTLFYHSQFNNDNNHAVANDGPEFKAISIKYKSNNELAGYTALPYEFKQDEIAFQQLVGLTPAEHQTIMQTQLEQGKNYFQDRIEMAPKIEVNEFGLKIKTVNNGDLVNTWCGMFGFTSHRTQEGHQRITELAAMTLIQPVKAQRDDIFVHEWKSESIVFRGIKKGEHIVTFMPVIKTSYTIDVENKQIDEWHNSGNLEAVVTGGGRDTFGLKYLATDYAENRKKYLTTKKLDIQLSGIVYVLDTYTPDNPQMSEGFAAYMPHKEMYEFGCHDFIGVLEEHREVTLFEQASVKGYIIKVRLINHPDIKDFFTIDMFVNKENMRLDNLENGMGISGMFQLQGEIAPPSI